MLSLVLAHRNDTVVEDSPVGASNATLNAGNSTSTSNVTVVDTAEIERVSLFLHVVYHIILLTGVPPFMSSDEYFRSNQNASFF